MNKVKQSTDKCVSLKLAQIESINKQFNERVNAIENINFATFSYDKPYDGEIINKIFFTYSDHYRGNSGTWMSVCQLHNPHINWEDRGYIKGVVTDLDGYLKLRHVNSINHNFYNTSGIYFPKFRKSIHKERHIAKCSDLVANIIYELDQIVKEKKDLLNKILHERTACSLLYYLRNI